MKTSLRGLFSTAFVLLAAQFLSAQNGVSLITGQVFGADGKPLEYASILLQRSADSTLAKLEYTDPDGSFRIAAAAAGEYFIGVSYVGLPDYRTEPFTLAEGEQLRFPDIRYAGSTVEMKEVTVTAQRPILEIQPDKLVFNVQNTINASGSNGLELLRKAPGVVVDNNDNITMLGRAGVQIYIDGKPSPLRGTDLAEFLKSLQADEIDAIELITNPSARFDAAGNAGIINIRLKKDKRLGSNGSANLGYSVGILSNYSGGVSGNYRNKTVNTFGSYNFNAGNWLNFMDLYRNQLGLTFDQTSVNGGTNLNHNFKAGADFFLNKKHTVGFLVNGYMGEFNMRANSRALIGADNQLFLDSILVASSRNDGQRRNMNFNINYRFDNGKETIWNLDADYGMFRNEGVEEQPNRYWDPTEQILLSERIYANNTPTEINITTFKIDHERPFLSGKLSAGIKSAVVATDNTFDFFNVIDGEKELNTDLSNQFDYTENVNAAYVNFQRQFKKLGISAGLRAEQTNSKGILTAFRPVDNAEVTRSYLDFFPSGGITYAVSQKHNLQLNYSRRINRPSYQDLNPFQGRLDELTYEQGNPFLRPEYANSLKLTHTFNYRFNTSLSYSHTRDQITRIVDTAGVAGSYITWLNLTDQYAYSLAFSAPVQIRPWWSSFTNLTGSLLQNQADYGGGKTVDLSAATFNIYSQHTFQLPKAFSLEISGWYNAPSLWGGTFEMNEMWSLDAGIQKKLLNNKANFRIAVSDIFRTNRWGGTSQFGVLDMRIAGGWDSRRFRTSLTYNFGNTEVKAARRRATGLEDEQQRIKTGN
jgi:iron complex outermembrane recepter protein